MMLEKLLLFSKSHVLILATVLICALSLSTWGQQVLSIADLHDNPEPYYNQIVSASGVIDNYHDRAPKGTAYATTFSLRDPRDPLYSIPVFVWKRLGLHNGSRVHVTGTFEKEMRVDEGTSSLVLEPKEEHYVNFALAADVMASVSCAGGSKLFVWDTRKPYPQQGAVVELFNERQGAHLTYGAAAQGSSVASICDPINAVNRTTQRLVVDFRYTVVVDRSLRAISVARALP
jgi:hypothetical protein